RPRSDGVVVLPRTVRTRFLRIDVTDVSAPGPIAARRLLDAVAIGEIEIPGLHAPPLRRHGAFATGCGAIVLHSRLSSAGAHELGAPSPIDGFANGWRVDRSCAVARFWFKPQRLALAAYGVSALAGLALLVLVLMPLWRRRGRTVAPRAPAVTPAPVATDSV